jgi:hypothetical protein
MFRLLTQYVVVHGSRAMLRWQVNDSPWIGRRVKYHWGLGSWSVHRRFVPCGGTRLMPSSFRVVSSSLSNNDNQSLAYPGDFKIDANLLLLSFVGKPSAVIYIVAAVMPGNDVGCVGQ